jgi:hypothetical protein
MKRTASQIKALARELDAFTEADLLALTGNELATIRNWRAKRYGPPYVQLGQTILYPKAAFRAWLERATESTTTATGEAAITPNYERGGRKA